MQGVLFGNLYAAGTAITLLECITASKNTACFFFPNFNGRIFLPNSEEKLLICMPRGKAVPFPAERKQQTGRRKIKLESEELVFKRQPHGTLRGTSAEMYARVCNVCPCM